MRLYLHLFENSYLLIANISALYPGLDLSTSYTFSVRRQTIFLSDSYLLSRHFYVCFALKRANKPRRLAFSSNQYILRISQSSQTLIDICFLLAKETQLVWLII